MSSVIDEVFQSMWISRRLCFFSKNGQVSKDRYKFVVGQTRLECVNQYKYLGVNVSASCKFLTAEKNLSLKASRALFSIK